MEKYSVYEDIAKRTDGDIYVGVVGPVRTGKSTFIKRFMETLVIPNASEDKRAVMTDELPQSGAGKTVMTTEPKFVPAEAMEIAVSKGAKARVRLVDCVGYGVVGASGFEEDGKPRLVKTPWQDSPMPFEEAGELGTRKVITEHSTIGVLVTTDGSITEIPRADYVLAEERVVAELKALQKPFVIVLNCKAPASQKALKNALQEKYGAPVLAINVEKAGEADFTEILKTALFEFPVSRIDAQIPKWLQSFPESNRVIGCLMNGLKEIAPKIDKMRDCALLESLFSDEDDFCNPTEILMDLGTGKVEAFFGVKEGLFYKELSGACGEEICDELQLMQLVTKLASMREGFEKIKDALADAEVNGYGVVAPTQAEYTLAKPVLVKRGAGYGVQFKAGASSYHIVKVDVVGRVQSIVGGKAQSEAFLSDTLQAFEKEDDSVWQTNIFGRTLRDLVGDELSGKTQAVSTELRGKIRRVMSKAVNEGKNNLLYFLF